MDRRTTLWAASARCLASSVRCSWQVISGESRGISKEATSRQEAGGDTWGPQCPSGTVSRAWPVATSSLRRTQPHFANAR